MQSFSKGLLPNRPVRPYLGFPFIPSLPSCFAGEATPDPRMMAVALREDNPRPTALDEPAQGGQGFMCQASLSKLAFTMRDPSGPYPNPPRLKVALKKVCCAAGRCFAEGLAELTEVLFRKAGRASEKRPRSFGEVLRRSARGASEKCFGEAPAELRRSASEKRPRSFGEVVFLTC